LPIRFLSFLLSSFLGSFLSHHLSICLSKISVQVLFSFRKVEISPFFFFSPLAFFPFSLSVCCAQGGGRRLRRRRPPPRGRQLSTGGASQAWSPVGENTNYLWLFSSLK